MEAARGSAAVQRLALPRRSIEAAATARLMERHADAPLLCPEAHLAFFLPPTPPITPPFLGAALALRSPRFASVAVPPRPLPDARACPSRAHSPRSLLPLPLPLLGRLLGHCDGAEKGLQASLRRLALALPDALHALANPGEGRWEKTHVTRKHGHACWVTHDTRTAERAQ